ncbi:hypothetical protein FHR86_003753 [Paenarthrobacter ilicis]|uniref:Uncharacterized protein n=1 Tax=Paenarthrobacter ilicis TaxID=43665 RepID=A0ABX0TLC4_9MICC|nr:hypothetical protein [Paenarthrobacter ilicis]NIJ03394.1 hypothetical protein [Paenarthrobacter ilicis]
MSMIEPELPNGYSGTLASLKELVIGTLGNQLKNIGTQLNEAVAATRADGRSWGEIGCRRGGKLSRVLVQGRAGSPQRPAVVPAALVRP